MSKLGRQIRVEHPGIVGVDAERVAGYRRELRPDWPGSERYITVDSRQTQTKRKGQDRDRAVPFYVKQHTTLWTGWQAFCLFCGTRDEFWKYHEVEH